MLNKLSLSARRNLLLAVTSLVVAYVRNYFQYNQYAWSSIKLFLVSWLLHYFAIGFLIIISLVLIKTHGHFFLGKDTASSRVTKDEFTVYVSIVLLVLAITSVFLVHYTMGNAGDFDDMF